MQYVCKCDMSYGMSYSIIVFTAQVQTQTFRGSFLDRRRLFWQNVLGRNSKIDFGSESKNVRVEKLDLSLNLSCRCVAV